MQNNKIRIELLSEKSRMKLGKKEILSIAAEAAACGINSIKLVGDDPLHYGGIYGLIKELKKIDGIYEVSMTTNGSGLPDMAKKLAVNGLDRINIKLNTLKYRKAGNADLDEIVAGINAATEAGLKPVKLNVVVMKDYNDDELMDFVQLTLQHQYEIRFIEMTEKEEASSEHSAVLTSELKEKLPALRIGLRDDDGNLLDDPREGTADVYMYPGARGKICFIEKRASDFKERTSKLFLGADGTLKRDEDDENGIAISKGADAGEIKEAVQSILK